MWRRFALAWPAAALAAVVTGIALSGCGRRGGSEPPLLPSVGPAGDAQPHSAQWLRAQPGKRLGECTFHLLNAQAEPIADWSGLELTAAAEGAPRFTLTARAEAPDDIYLYVTYPGERLALDDVELASERAGEYLMLALPHRIEDVLVVGLTRLGTRRGVALGPGPLVELVFAPGRERTYRTTSHVNDDPTSSTGLEIDAVGQGWVLLGWEERNVGDYNNNSQVEIADITPIGLYFGQRVAEADDPSLLHLVDGDFNGEINVADLTPIGRNFQRYIEGYTLYRALGATPQDADFAPIERPTVLRATVWDAASDDDRKRRLRYSYQATLTVGFNHFYVRAYSADDGAPSEGPPSNRAIIDATQQNMPPQWVTTEGLTSAVGSGDGVRVTFGMAADPESGTVTYDLRYVAGYVPVGTPGTVSIKLPPEVIEGAPPYTYRVAGLSRGAAYTFNLQAEDPEGNRTTNNENLTAVVPALAFSLDTWPYHRCDAARTGCNAAANFVEPIAEQWTSGLQWPGGELIPNEPVASQSGWLSVFAGALGNPDLLELHRYDLTTQELLSRLSGPGERRPVYPALDGDNLAVGTATGAALYDLAAGGPPTLYTDGGPVLAAPLLLGDYLVTADMQGVVRARNLLSEEVEWSWADPGPWPGDPPPFSLSPAADAAHLYLVSDDGLDYKLDLLSGELVQSGDIGAKPVGEALALDTTRGLLYLPTEADFLIEVDTATLEVTNRWPRPGDESDPCAPCLILHHDPPLAVLGVLPHGMIETRGVVFAINLEDGSQAWSTLLNWLDRPLVITANAGRIFVSCWGGKFYVLDFDGLLRQRVQGGTTNHSGLVVADEQLALVGDDSLHVYGAPAEDLPPQWASDVGISGLLCGDGEITVQWRTAGDDHGAPVYYAIYLNPGEPPRFEPPFGTTQVLVDIPPGGELFSFADPHNYTIDGLDNGTRYYVGVRTYDRPWDDSPQIDDNTNWLAVTPPWQREELILGDDLPLGEMHFLRGLTDPAGTIHLIYNDADNDDPHLSHLWGDTGNWSHEGENLAGYAPLAFEPTWDAAADELVIGWADADFVGMLRRTGADSWVSSVFGGPQPVDNPQVSLALGSESAFAYTQYISGVFPEIEEHYYIIQTDTGAWQAAEVLDDVNYSGRDLELVLNPADPADPWTAYQRGGNYAFNRLTPQQGECMYAQDDGLGGWVLTEVDAGANAPDSDCGKRVRQVLGGDSRPRLAYFDLNASASDPRGQLKYARYDGVDWNVELVHHFDLSFQTVGSLQFTYGELGLALSPAGQPLIALLERQTISATAGVPHYINAAVWVREGPGDWRRELLTDDEYAFPRDREPCVLLLTPDGTWHVFYASGQEQPQPIADKLVHLWRPPPP